MKISKLVMASAIAMAGSASAGLIWSPDTHGSIGSGQVLDLAGVDGGWWYSYSDADNDDGASTVSWGNASGEWSDNIDTQGKISVSFTTGAGFDYPFAGIGFNWISDDNGGEGPYDVSAATGLCLNYTSAANMTLELKWDGTTYGYATFGATITKQATAAAKDYAFSTFKRGYTDADHPGITIAQALTYTTGVQLKYAAAAGGANALEVFAIGTTGSCGVVPTLSIASASSLKASLSGSSLAFSGLSKKTAKVEVINLQGQVVASKTISSAMNTVDLSKAAHGVYVVKAFGKGLSFSKMITLK